MTHVGDRMAMLRFQSNRPYHWRSGGGCNCGGNNFSIFNQYNMGPMMPSSPFGFGGGFGGGLFRAGFISNLVFGCLDYGMKWTGQILNWCGIGGGVQPNKEKEPEKDETLDTLKETFKDSKYVVKKNGDEYIVIDNEAKVTHRGKTLDDVLKAAGYDKTKTNTTNTENNTKGQGNGTAKTEAEKAQIKTETSTKLEGAKTSGKVNLPDGYSLGEPTVADDGKVTITIKHKEGNQEKVENIVGDNADDAIAKIAKRCQELQKGVADAELAKHSDLKAPAGYKIETAGANKDGKTQPTYVLDDGKGNKTEFNSIEELKAGIAALNKTTVAANTRGNNRAVVKGKNPQKMTPEEAANKKIENAGLQDNVRIEGDKIVFRYHGGGTKTTAFSAENLEAIIKDETEHASKIKKEREDKKTENDEKVKNWNKEHPDKPIRYENGAYVTTVRVYTNLGWQTGDASGKTFKELETAVKDKKEELEKICHKPRGGGYTAETGYHTVGRAMQH